MYIIVINEFMNTLQLSRIYLSAILLFTTLSFSLSAYADEQKSADRQCVVLLHGLARTSHSMEKMEQEILRQGFVTANIDYPSRTMKIEQLAELAVSAGVESCRSQNAHVVHFVSHSLGGILVRYYLSQNELPELGKVVMLAPPNQGSLIADTFRNEQWFKWLTGPAGQQLGTDKHGIPGLLSAVDYPTGVIAGNDHNPVDNWMAEIIPGEDDGKVAVESAKLDGMADFIVLPSSHITIMKDDAVIEQSIYFLQRGHFSHGP